MLWQSWPSSPHLYRAERATRTPPKRRKTQAEPDGVERDGGGAGDWRAVAERNRKTETSLQAYSVRPSVLRRTIPASRPTPSIVVVQTQVRDQILPHNVAERVLQLHELDEQI